MYRQTFTAASSVTLKTPYGTVLLLFQSLKECVVLLPDQHTEPPTPYLTMDGVAIEGRLVFECWGRVWELQQDDERSRCWDINTDCQIGREQRDKLTKTLSACLSRWVKTTPNARQAISKIADQQAIERLQGEIDHLNAQIDVLVSQREAKQHVICVLREGLIQEPDT